MENGSFQDSDIKNPVHLRRGGKIGLMWGQKQFLSVKYEE